MEFWEDWNYNVGHDDMIEDRNNDDLIAFMSRYGVITEPNVTMVYTPIDNEHVKIEKSSYNILSGCYDMYPINETNVCSNS